MGDKTKADGKKLALRLLEKVGEVSKREPLPEPPILETSAIVEAIEALSDKQIDLGPLVEAIEAIDVKPQDVTPIVNAIKGVELKSNFDLSAVVRQVRAVAEKPATNTKIIADKLDLLVKATEKNTAVLAELVQVAKMDKTVEYDDFGRIVKIQVEK